jgi:hypothetical protein
LEWGQSEADLGWLKAGAILSVLISKPNSGLLLMEEKGEPDE